MRWFVFLLFFISGACGLIYQVAWTRIITHVFGTTVIAVSLVLTAFMTGLAIGSYFLGKRADRSKSPLRLYAFYEVGIGLAALASLFLMQHLSPLYVWMNNAFGDSLTIFTLFRFCTAFLILIVPTILMGATLPILSRFVITHLGKVGRNLGSLYGINTFGAVCGSLLAGFVLIGHLGVSTTVYLAAFLNISVGIAAWLGARRYGEVKEGASEEAGKPAPSASRKMDGRYKLLLWAFAISGFTSFGYEVFWTRSLVFLLGNSTYAFVTMLTAFLTGIALGGYLIRFFADRVKNPLRLFGWIEIGIGLSAAVAMPLLTSFVYSKIVPSLFSSTAGQWGVQIFYRFGAAFLVMMVPTTLLGATFPLVGKTYVKDLKHTGSDVGKVYAVNTAGNILGAFLPVLLILPVLGIHKGVLLLAALNVGAGGVVLLSQWRGLRVWHVVPGSALACLILFIALYPIEFQFPSDGQLSGDKVLFYREGVSATTKVFLNVNRGEKNISVDGISIGGTNPYVDQKQTILAHLPKLLLQEYRSELSVGLGSGILIGECAKHREMKRIVCAEIAPSVVDGAAYFKEEHNDVLNDPRVEIIVNDGVNYLLTTSEKYDIISSDAKSRPEFGGNGVFFSREYYTLMKEHLTEKGLVIQWIPVYYPKSDYLMILRTFTGVFPHASLWFFPHESSFLIGSKNPIEIDFEKIESKLQDPARPFEEIRKFGLNSAEVILSHYVASEEGLRAKTDGIAENSFERPFIEFYSLEDYSVPVHLRELENLDFLLSLRAQEKAVPGLKNISPEDKNRLDVASRAHGRYLEGLRLMKLSGKKRQVKFTDIKSCFDSAIAMAPWNNAIRYYAFSHMLESTRQKFNNGLYRDAEISIRYALQLYSGNGEGHYFHGALLANQKKRTEAIFELEKAVALDPKLLVARRQLVGCYLEEERFEDAVLQLKGIVERDRDDVVALNNLGWYLAEKMGQPAQGQAYLKRAYLLAPDQPAVIDSYAWVSYQRGDMGTAREVVQRGGGYWEGNPEYQRRKEIILKSRGKKVD